MKPIAWSLVLVAAALSACSLQFGPSGTWGNPEHLPSSLEGTTPVVATDGEILFLGRNTTVLRFDPLTDRWSDGAPMPVDENGFSVVALSNGLVLVAGGNRVGFAGPIATTLLYDPQRNAWTEAGNLQVARADAAAVELADGRVLLAGGSVPLATPVQLPDGSASTTGFTTTAETFDPQSNAWSEVGSMKVARGSMTLVALRHGGALAAGGCPFASQAHNTGDALSTAEVFSPVTGAWAPTQSMPEARCGGSGLLLRDGRTLVVGGSPSNVQLGYVNDAIVYDEAKRAWTRAGSTVSGASAPVLLPGGEVFLAAVQAGEPNGHLVPLVVGGQIFDPASGEWSFATSISVPVAFQPGLENLRPLVDLSGRTAVVLLGMADVALAFDPQGTPPPGLILDSSGLALILGAVAAALCLMLAAQYIRNRIRE